LQAAWPCHGDDRHATFPPLTNAIYDRIFYSQNILMAKEDIHSNNSSGTFNRLSALNPMHIRKRGRHAKALFALSLVCFFWGTTWVASKHAVKYMPALQMAGIRQFLGGLCYVSFFVFRGDKWPRKKEWIPIIILSFLNFVLSNGLSTWGVEFITAGLAAIIGAIFPLWLVVIGLFSKKSKIPLPAIIGLLLGFGGVCVIFYEHLHDLLNSGFRFGIILSLIATWTWAFGTLYTKKKAASFNPYFSLGLQMLIAGITLYSFSSATGRSIPLTEIHPQAWLSIGYLVIFGSVISFMSYLYALQNLPAEQVSLYAYMNPVVAVLFGWLLFKERLSGFIIAGGIITLYGVYLVNRAFKTPAPEMPEAEGV
jgi:drug/metabolite transporter (DMT)-like permease